MSENRSRLIVHVTDLCQAIAKGAQDHQDTVMHREQLAMIAERVAPDLVDDLRVRGEWNETSHRVLQATGALLARLEHAEELEELTAGLSVNPVQRLHDRIWRSAEGRWLDEDYDGAVDNAARELFQHIRSRLGAADGDGTELAQSAFSANPPKPGEPRLRPMIPAGFAESSAMSFRDGVLAIARGCALALRNVHTHERPGIDQEEAYEKLATLSLLARWVDDSNLETHQEGRP